MTRSPWKAFKAGHYLDDEALLHSSPSAYLPERKIQDYRSSYNDIREWQRVNVTLTPKIK
jgi:type I restriction enzyme R subunit